MARPKARITFKCPKCKKIYKGEQESLQPWDETKINHKYCFACDKLLFHPEVSGVESFDADIAMTGA